MQLIHRIHLLRKTVLLCIAMMMLSGFTVEENATVLGQPLDERQAQNALPQSHDPMWEKFIRCKVKLDEKKHTYSITYTPEVKALEGKQMTVSGFMMPLDATETFKHFLLSKRTPTCGFCPPGEPNEIVEVFTSSPIAYDEGIVTVTGTMHFTNNPDMGLFFQLKNAAATASKPSLLKRLKNQWLGKSQN